MDTLENSPVLKTETYAHKLIKRFNMLKYQLGIGETEIDDADSKKVRSSNEETQISNVKDISEPLEPLRNETYQDWKPEEESLSKSYLMWENNSTLCWLDSSMSLLCHNKTLSHIVNDESSQISNIIKGYKSAISIFNDYSNESAVEERLQRAKNILLKVQGNVLEYLQPSVKPVEGQPDSAFCSLLNLISENSQIKNLFLAEFTCIRNCANCAIPRARNNKKTIITLSKVGKFNPQSPVSLYKCSCGSPDQEMVIKYKTLPQCLIFHFENGAGEGDFDSLDFELNDRKYKLSGLIKLEKINDLSHFVTWVRDISTDSWLECNDLNSDILSFSVVPPAINLKDLCIVMYEALDEKGTIPHVSEDTDQLFEISTDDTNSSDIPVIYLSDEDAGTETKEENHTPEEKTSSTVFLGGLFKPDKTDYDSSDKISKKELNGISSDGVSKSKNVPETSKIKVMPKQEKVSTENSKLHNTDLQDNASSTSSDTDNVPLQMDAIPKPVISDSPSGSKNDLKNGTVVNIKQSLVKDNIKMCKKDENKPIIPSGSDMVSFAEPILDNTVKTSKEISDKPLIGTSSSIENMVAPNDTVSGNRKNPSRLAENLLGKDHAVVSNSYSIKSLLNASENQDNKNLNYSQKSPIKPQNNLKKSIITDSNTNADYSNTTPVELQDTKLGRNISAETNSLDPNNHVNAAGNDCTQDSPESCARTKGLPSSHKELKKKFKTDESVFKKCHAITNEDAAFDFIDNLLFAHDDEKIVGTSKFLNSTVQNSAQLQNSDPQSLKSSLNLLASTTKKTNDERVLETKTVVDTLETKNQNINASLPLESHFLGAKASEDSSSEIHKKTESNSNKQNHMSGSFKTTLNTAGKKYTANVFENKGHANISRDVAVKLANSVKEIFVENAKNLSFNSTVKEKNYSAPNVSENKNSTLEQIAILNNQNTQQPEVSQVSSLKTNEKLNIQSVESTKVTESISLKKSVKQQMRKYIEKFTNFSQNKLQVENLPSKVLFVLLTRLKDCEIANYTSGNFNFEEPKKMKSLEELTKTVVVKVEQTDSKSILKSRYQRAGPPKPKIVESVEPVRKSSRINSRNMRRAAEAVKAKELVSETVAKKRKQFQEQCGDDASSEQNAIKRIRQTLGASSEVINKTLKGEKVPKRPCGKRSATDMNSDVQSGIYSQRSTKNKNFNAEESIHPKRQRNFIEPGDSDIQSHLLSSPSLKSTNSSQAVHDEPVLSLKVLDTFANENSCISVNENNQVTDYELPMHSGDQTQPNSGVSHSSNVLKHTTANVKEHSDKCDKNEECTSVCECNDLQTHEVLNIAVDYALSFAFEFLNLHKMD